MVIYIVLILLFGIGYTFVQYDPDELSENFEKGSRFIPGVRPGKETRDYLSRVLLSLALIGTPVLALIAVTPQILDMATANTARHIANKYAFGGTGMILLVTVLLDTIKTFKASITTGEYSQKTKKMLNQTGDAASL